MGFKSLTLQMIPWCFYMVHPTSNPITTPTPTHPVRLIGSDGRLRLFDRPVAASDLMKDHPYHLICRSDSFFIGRKVPSLSQTDQLEPGQSYFLLPSHFFHSVLSFVTLASSFSNPNPNNRGILHLMRPFEIQKTDSGILQIRVLDEFMERIQEEEEKSKGSLRVCTTEALEKDYRQLVGRSNSWKPKLETIRESERRRRNGGAASGEIKRRKKKTHHLKNKDPVIVL